MKGANIEAIAADCLSRKGQYRDERMAALKRQNYDRYIDILVEMIEQSAEDLEINGAILRRNTENFQRAVTLFQRL